MWKESEVLNSDWGGGGGWRKGLSEIGVNKATERFEVP